MAISWDIKLTNVNTQSKRADVTATRTDDQSTIIEPPYSFTQVILETPAQRSAFLDTVWNKHLAWLAKQTEIETFIDNLEQQGKANLEAREV